MPNPITRRSAAVMLLAGAMTIALAAPAPAQVAIQPSYVEVDLSTGRPSGRFVVTNGSDEEQRFRIKARFFDYTENGTLVFPADAHDRSIADWIRFNPTEFAIPAKARRTVRFIILPRGKVEPGEYWAAMSLENLKPRKHEMDVGEGRSLSLSVTASVLVPIFGHAGDITYSAEIESVRFVATPNGPALEAYVANTGAGRIFAKGAYELLDAQGNKLTDGKIGYSYIMAGGRRHFGAVVAPRLAPGPYKVRLTYDTGHDDVKLDRRVDLTWSPPPDPAPAAADTEPPADDTPPDKPDA